MIATEATIRQVMFSPPRTTPAIYWMHGHVSVAEFLTLHSQLDNLPIELRAAQIKHGYASKKLSNISLYISDTPLENFEPITYWIPGDYA